MHLGGKGATDAVHAIGQGIGIDDGLYGFRQTVEGEECSGKKEKRHDEKIDDQWKSLHILHARSDSSAKSGEEKSNQRHEHQGHR